MLRRVITTAFGVSRSNIVARSNIGTMGLASVSTSIPSHIASTSRANFFSTSVPLETDAITQQIRLETANGRRMSALKKLLIDAVPLPQSQKPKSAELVEAIEESIAMNLIRAPYIAGILSTQEVDELTKNKKIDPTLSVILYILKGNRPENFKSLLKESNAPLVLNYLIGYFKTLGYCHYDNYRSLLQMFKESRSENIIMCNELFNLIQDGALSLKHGPCHKLPYAYNFIFFCVKTLGIINPEIVDSFLSDFKASSTNGHIYSSSTFVMNPKIEPVDRIRRLMHNGLYQEALQDPGIKNPDVLKQIIMPYVGKNDADGLLNIANAFRPLQNLILATLNDIKVEQQSQGRSDIARNSEEAITLINLRERGCAINYRSNTSGFGRN